MVSQELPGHTSARAGITVSVNQATDQAASQWVTPRKQGNPIRKGTLSQVPRPAPEHRQGSAPAGVDRVTGPGGQRWWSVVTCAGATRPLSGGRRGIRPARAIGRACRRCGMRGGGAFSEAGRKIFWLLRSNSGTYCVILAIGWAMTTLTCKKCGLEFKLIRGSPQLSDDYNSAASGLRAIVRAGLTTLARTSWQPWVSTTTGCGAGRRSLPLRSAASLRLIPPISARIVLVPPALVEQLRPDGRMVLPVGATDAQTLTVLDKDALGRVTRRQFLPVCFSRLETMP